MQEYDAAQGLDRDEKRERIKMATELARVAMQREREMRVWRLVSLHLNCNMLHAIRMTWRGLCWLLREPLPTTSYHKVCAWSFRSEECPFDSVVFFLAVCLFVI